MKLRFLSLALLAGLLGATTTERYQIMLHYDCPVVAHWCAPLAQDACRTVRPSDDYDFVVMPNTDHHKRNATVEMLSPPGSFVMPTVTLSPGAIAAPILQPSPTAVNIEASYSYTAVAWTLSYPTAAPAPKPTGTPSIEASFVLWRSSLRLIVMTKTPLTQIRWEGDCASVNNKLPTATPTPSPATKKTALPL